MAPTISTSILLPFLHSIGKVSALFHNENVCTLTFRGGVYTSSVDDLGYYHYGYTKERLYHTTIRKIAKDYEKQLEEYLTNLITPDMELLDRLKAFKERNPDIKDAVESYFPETIDDKPFIKVNDMFARKIHTEKAYIYQLVSRNRELKIRNVSLDDYWKGSILPTNDKTCIKKEELYLNEYDFKALLKQSGVKVDSIAIIPPQAIEMVYDFIF